MFVLVVIGQADAPGTTNRAVVGAVMVVLTAHAAHAFAAIAVLAGVAHDRSANVRLFDANAAKASAPVSNRTVCIFGMSALCGGNTAHLPIAFG